MPSTLRSKSSGRRQCLALNVTMSASVIDICTMYSKHHPMFSGLPKSLPAQEPPAPGPLGLAGASLRLLRRNFLSERAAEEAQEQESPQSG